MPANKYILTATTILFSAIGFAQGLSVSHQDKKISYEGRIIINQDAAELMWPGTSVTIHFKGTTLSGEFKDSDTSNYYNVIIDNKSIHKIHFDKERKKYLLADHLPFAEHTVQVFKRTEWDKGSTLFYGFQLDDKALLLNAPEKPKRKIEFFGNSITCGYSIEDYVNDSPDGFYENNYDAYGAITARHFHAQYHCTSKSGIGIMVSWFPLIMPEMYDRLNPNDSSSKWDFSKYIPDVVVINLFQNDAWIVEMPENDQFKNKFGTKKPDENFIVESYKNFVQTIRNKYPNAQIICMLGNMDITQKNSPWPSYVQKAVKEINDKKIYSLFVPYKETQGHPKTAEQKTMADALIKFIEENIKW